MIPEYGLGVDESGRPYYAMRFVRGETLKESIERLHGKDGLTRGPGERSLAFRELLGRFVDVTTLAGTADRTCKPGREPRHQPKKLRTIRRKRSRPRTRARARIRIGCCSWSVACMMSAVAWRPRRGHWPLWAVWHVLHEAPIFFKAACVLSLSSALAASSRALAFL